jgi:hypothetical protein
VDVGAPASAVRPKIIDDGHFVTAGDAFVDDVRADEARAAGHHDAQRIPSG